MSAASSVDWRDALTEAVEAHGSRWSVVELRLVVAGCDASLVDVCGWLSDELRMGQMQRALVWPQHYERVPGLPSQRQRLAR